MNDLLAIWSTLLFAGKWLFTGLVFLALVIILNAVRQEARGHLAGASEAAPVSAGRLRVLDGGADAALRPGRILPLRPVNTLGAAKENTLTLTDPYVSGRHARLTWDGADWWVEDLGSANGTLVDGQPCRPHTRCKLTSGQRLSLGEVALELLA
jgi:hypothetical protein